MKHDIIKAVLRREELEAVPVALWRHFPQKDLEADSLCKQTVEFQKRFDCDLLKVCPSGGYASIAWGAKIEYYGKETGAPRTRIPRIRKLEDWGSLEELDVNDGILGEMTKSIECIGKALEYEVPYIQTVFSPLTIGIKIAGERITSDLKEDPELMKEALKVISRTMIEFSKANLDAGANGIFFATQTANTKNLSKIEYSRFCIACDVPILRAVRNALFNTVHIHGEDIYFDVIAKNYPTHSISWHDQRTKPSLSEAAEKFDGVLLGGIDEWGILVEGSEDDVEEMVKESIKSVHGKRLIIAPGCVIPLTAPESNLVAVLKTARKYSEWR